MSTLYTAGREAVGPETGFGKQAVLSVVCLADAAPATSCHLCA